MASVWAIDSIYGLLMAWLNPCLPHYQYLIYGMLVSTSHLWNNYKNIFVGMAAECYIWDISGISQMAKVRAHGYGFWHGDSTHYIATMMGPLRGQCSFHIFIKWPKRFGLQSFPNCLHMQVIFCNRYNMSLCNFCNAGDQPAGLIPGLRPANERRHCFVMTSIIGWMQA